MSGAAETVQRERTFEAADEVKIPDVAGTSTVDRSRVRLTATYWDTVHRRLLRWGHTLSHRRAADGSEDRWTLKLAIPSRKKGDSQARRGSRPWSGTVSTSRHPRSRAGCRAARRTQAGRHDHHRSTARRAGRLGAYGAGRARRRSRLLHSRSASRTGVPTDRGRGRFTGSRWAHGRGVGRAD